MVEGTGGLQAVVADVPVVRIHAEIGRRAQIAVDQQCDTVARGIGADVGDVAGVGQRQRFRSCALRQTQAMDAVGAGVVDAPVDRIAPRVDSPNRQIALRYHDLRLESARDRSSFEDLATRRVPERKPVKSVAGQAMSAYRR